MGRILSRKRRIVLLAGGAMAAIGAAVWGFFILSGPGEIVLPEGLSVEALQAAWDNPAELVRRVREATLREDLTEGQRRQLQVNVLYVWGSQINRRVDEYLTAAPTEQQAVLDRHLDAMRKRYNEMNRQQDEFLSQQASSAADAMPASSPHVGIGGDGGQSGNRPTRQQRKACSESSDPDKMARWVAYFTALRERAEQRGIDLPPVANAGPEAGGQTWARADLLEQ